MAIIRKITLKLRVLLIVGFLLLVTALIESALQVRNWKQAARSEIDSSMELAKRFVENSFTSDDSNPKPNQALLWNLHELRHIRVISKNASQQKSTILDNNKKYKEASVPGWFVKFIYPYQEGLPKIEISSVDSFSSYLIEADPSDEIIEVWEDFRTQLASMIIFFVLTTSIVYIGLFFGLKPLNDLFKGFEKLEDGDFDVNLSKNIAPELSRINQKFMHMVSVLQQTSKDNSVLTKKMVSLQEEERKNISRELHDVIAPHLFGIRVSTSKAQSSLDENNHNEVSEQLSQMDSTVNDLQEQTRRLLSHLRPLVLDDLSLEDAIMGLVKTREVVQKEINWEIKLDGLEKIQDDTLKVTLYRIIQECITNIIRHANANHAKIAVTLVNSEISTLLILVEDNGDNFDSDFSPGFGLIGMKERVNALGGKFNLLNSGLGGVKVCVEIPVN